MPLLSVVIVTYNSIPFIRMCLDSLLTVDDARLEVVVVDNNSCDLTADIIESDYRSVRIIRNSKNVGFGKACNQGMGVATGKYYLMLNPDTIVPEHLTDKVLAFMDEHPNCGAMGVKMVDGNGRYLPESKRGLPTLFRSLCRFTGLAGLFGRSKVFAGYYMGHLSVEEVHEIEILSGAFMLLDAAAIDKCGGFDERFFMYGEDIDLSWRIKTGGYQVYYNPSITIIHFKGESTTSDTKYLKAFYEAMDIFYDIHFRSRRHLVLRRMVRFFTRVLGKMAAVKQKLKLWLVNDQQIFPLKENYYMLSSSGSSANTLSPEAVSGSLKAVIQPGKPLNTTQTCFCTIDLSSLKPSEAIDFVCREKKNFKGFLWLPSDQSSLLYPISASHNTHIWFR